MYVCAIVFVCLCVKRRMMKIMYININRCYERNHLNFFVV